MKKICIITSSKDLQELISNTLFDGSAPVRSNGGLLGFWGNCQVLVVMTRSGKVNVAVTVSEVVNDIRPDAVIIAGMASSLSSTLLPGSLIVGSHFCYYDVCFGLNMDFGRYPDEPKYYHSDDRIVSRMIETGLTFHQGLMLSGDSLVDSRPAARKILNHFGKASHFTEIGDTHFDDSRLSVLGHCEQGQRNAELVVEVSLCFMSFEFLRQHRIDHFLGAGFSDAAGDTDHGDIELLAVRFCDLFYRVQR